MIVSSLDHIERRLPPSSLLKRGLDFLRRPGLRDLPDGRLPIEGDRVFAIVQRYETAQTVHPRFEYHRNYTDVQFIVSGTEVIGWAPAETVSVTESYAPDEDIAFGTVPGNQWTPVLLTAGQAAVFYPEDGHAPRLAAGKPSSVTKIVVKVAV